VRGPGAGERPGQRTPLGEVQAAGTWRQVHRPRGSVHGRGHGPRSTIAATGPPPSGP
jgi:hypothetical protein